MIFPITFIIACILSTASIVSAQTPFLGVSNDGDQFCQPSDLQVGPGMAQPVLFVTDSSGVGYFSIACTVCLTDATGITLDTVITSLPSAWTFSPVQNSEDNPGVAVSDTIKNAYPNYKCWVLQGTDFSFSNPIFPGSSQEVYRLDFLASGTVGFVIDKQNSGWFTSSFVSGSFLNSCDTENSGGSGDPVFGIFGGCAPDTIVVFDYYQGLPIGVSAGGIAPLSWSATGLPDGLHLSNSQGDTVYVQGAATQTGDYSFYVRVEDFTGAADSVFCNLNVREPQTFEYSLSGGTASPGSTFVVDLLGTSDGLYRAFSVNLAFDPNVFAGMNAFIDLAGTVSQGANISITHMTDSTVAFAVVKDFQCPPGFPAGTNLLGQIHIPVKSDGSTGGTSVFLVDSPPRLNRMTTCSGSNQPVELDSIAVEIASRPFVRGDASSDGTLSIVDPLLILGHQYRDIPIQCLDAADYDNDGEVAVSDVSRLLGLLYTAGPPLPTPSCETDSTPDFIGCQCHSSCSSCKTMQQVSIADSRCTVTIELPQSGVNSGLAPLYLVNHCPLYGFDLFVNLPDTKLALASTGFDFAESRTDPDGTRAGFLTSFDLSKPIEAGRHYLGDLILKADVRDLSVAIRGEFMTGDLQVGSVTGKIVNVTEDIPPMPASLAAHASPNPFNPQTRIDFNVPQEGHTSIRIYSSTGRLVEELLSDVLPAGKHHANWHTSDASGTYFFEVVVGDARVTGKITLVR